MSVRGEHYQLLRMVSYHRLGRSRHDKVQKPVGRDDDLSDIKARALSEYDTWYVFSFGQLCSYDTLRVLSYPNAYTRTYHIV